jgi:aminoglycoside 3-N-acetyltransferase
MLLPKSAGIEKSQLKADLKRMGIAKGDHISVALSFKKIGFVKNGPDAFIDALLEVIGPEGTLMMNTFTLSFPLAEINRDYVFDPSATVPYTGLVPTTFMKRKDTVRSWHPTCSVAAVGKLSKYLTDGHDEHSRPYLPYEKLAKVGGKHLCIGINDRLVGLRHEAQRRAGLFVVPTFMGVLYKSLHRLVKVFVWQSPPCNKRLPELVPELERKGIIRRGKIGNASSIVGNANELLEDMSAMLKKDPTLNLCCDFSCLTCRELERRMNLYGKIKNPKYFQRSLLTRRILSYRNELLLRRYSRVSFQAPGQRRRIHPDYILESGIRRFLWLISKFLK